MFCVYWIEANVPKSKIENNLGVALKLCEEKRKNGFRFVSLVSEIEGNCTKMGVSAPDENYDWKKRRR